MAVGGGMKSHSSMKSHSTARYGNRESQWTPDPSGKPHLGNGCQDIRRDHDVVMQQDQHHQRAVKVRQQLAVSLQRAQPHPRSLHCWLLPGDPLMLKRGTLVLPGRCRITGERGLPELRDQESATSVGVRGRQWPHAPLVWRQERLRDQWLCVTAEATSLQGWQEVNTSKISEPVASVSGLFRYMQASHCTSLPHLTSLSLTMPPPRTPFFPAAGPSVLQASRVSASRSPSARLPHSR